MKCRRDGVVRSGRALRCGRKLRWRILVKCAVFLRIGSAMEWDVEVEDAISGQRLFRRAEGGSTRMPAVSVDATCGMKE